MSPRAPVAASRTLSSGSARASIRAGTAAGILNVPKSRSNPPVPHVLFGICEGFDQGWYRSGILNLPKSPRSSLTRASVGICEGFDQGWYRSGTINLPQGLRCPFARVAVGICEGFDQGWYRSGILHLP